MSEQYESCRPYLPPQASISSSSHREQQYFEKRSLGFIDAFEGYRKSDALLGQTYFNGIKRDPDLVERRLNYRASNVFVMNLNNC